MAVVNSKYTPRDVIKHKRGQVWMRRVEYETSGSVQSSNRPCLIISNDRGNISQSTVMIVKISSVVKNKMGINVPFFNDREQENVILCNQLETINTDELAYYLYTVTDDVMSKVESAVLRAQGIAYEKDIPSAINEVYRILSRLEVLKADNSKTVPKDQEKILETANKLEELYTSLAKYYEQSSEEIQKRVDPYTQYLVHSELGLIDKPIVDSSNIEEEIENSKSKKRYYKSNKWNKERMEEFLKDQQQLTLEELTTKWGFKNSKSCSQMYYHIRNRYSDMYGEFKGDIYE